MLTLGYKVKSMFFDRPAITNAVDRAKRKRLSRAGAFIRTRARGSIRRRKAVSQPGSPPSAHSTDKVATIKNILFAYDASIGGVVVGPVGLNIHYVSGGRLKPGEVPNVLEFGGRLGVVERQNVDGTWGRADLRSRRRMIGANVRTRYASYAARPFMGPALRHEAPKFPDLFRNSIVRAA